MVFTVVCLASAEVGAEEWQHVAGMGWVESVIGSQSVWQCCVLGMGGCEAQGGWFSCVSEKVFFAMGSEQTGSIMVDKLSPVGPVV